MGSWPDLDRHQLPCVLVYALIHLDEGVGYICEWAVAGVTKPTSCCNQSFTCFPSWSCRKHCRPSPKGAGQCPGAPPLLPTPSQGFQASSSTSASDVTMDTTLAVRCKLNSKMVGMHSHACHDATRGVCDNAWAEEHGEIVKDEGLLLPPS
jgi:hypothetical protein